MSINLFVDLCICFSVDLCICFSVDVFVWFDVVKYVILSFVDFRLFVFFDLEFKMVLCVCLGVGGFCEHKWSITTEDDTYHYKCEKCGRMSKSSRSGKR